MPDAQGNPYPVNKDSLLLYLETCAVDHNGLIKSVKMNEEEFTQCKQWKKEGFLKVFERVYSKQIIKQKNVYPYTHIVQLSRRAMRKAHRLRRQRAKRMWEKESDRWRK